MALLVLCFISGHLARREVAISMPLSMIDNRLGRVDYVPLPISLGSNYIVYKLPSPGDRLDTTLLDIVSPDFVLFLLGPLCFTAVVSAVVHVATRSCRLASPQPVTWKSFR